MTLASRIGVMNRGRDRADRHADRDLRVPVDEVRGGLHRLGQHVRRPAGRGPARPRAHPVRRDSGASSTSITASVLRRAPPCGRPSGRRRSTSSARRPADTRENYVRGVVKEIAYMGDVSVYLVKIDSGKTMRVTLPNIERLSDDERILWDETVYLTWHPGSPSGRDAVVAHNSANAYSGFGSGRVGPLWELFFRFGPPRWSHYITAQLGRAASGHCGALPLAGAVLPGPVPDRPEDLLRGVRAAGPAAVRAGPALARGWRACSCKLVFASYTYLLHEPLYVSAWLYSVKVAAFSTLLCLLVAYPMAYAIARSPPTARNLLLMLVILPFWTSFLLRVYAWIGLLKTDGVINQVLMGTRHHQRAAGDDEHELRGLHRHRLFLPAVHDPAAVFQPREARQHAARGRAGPGLGSGPCHSCASPCRCPCPASWPARCWCSFRRWANT